jgi:hypothetical protein
MGIRVDLSIYGESPTYPAGTTRAHIRCEKCDEENVFYFDSIGDFCEKIRSDDFCCCGTDKEISNLKDNLLKRNPISDGCFRQTIFGGEAADLCRLYEAKIKKLEEKLNA